MVQGSASTVTTWEGFTPFKAPPVKVVQALATALSAQTQQLAFNPLKHKLKE